MEGPQRHGVGRWLSRVEVARLLGVHKSTVRRLEKSGSLVPFGGPGERRWFDPEKLASVLQGRRRPHAARTAGEKAALAFSLFKRGASQGDVVIALQEPPHRVGKLYEDWRRTSGHGRVGSGQDVSSKSHPSVGPICGDSDRLHAAEVSWRAELAQVVKRFAPARPETAPARRQR